MSNRFRILSLLGVAFVAALVAAPVSRSARAGDAPAAPAAPPKVPALENALLGGLVGSWNVESTTMGGPGKGAQRVRRAIGGSALLVESHISVGGREHYATAVLRLDDGGKTAKYWRIDTLSMPDLTLFKGTVSDTSLDVTSETGGLFHLEKTADGYTASSKRGEMTIFTSKYTRATKDVEIDAPNAPKEGPNAAIVGAWDVVGGYVPPGAATEVKATGTSHLSWTDGGAALLHDYEMTSPLGLSHSLGIRRVGKTATAWWFTDDQVDPMVAQGSDIDTGWQATSTIGGKPLKMVLTKKDDSFEMKFDVDGKPFGHETYTRKK